MWNDGGLYLGLRSMTFEFDEEEEYSGSKPIWTLHCLSFCSVWLWLLVWVWLWHWAISCRHLPATEEKSSLRRKWQFCPHLNVEITKLILKKDEMNFPSNFSLTLGRWGLNQRASLPTIRAILWDPQNRFTNHELPRPMSPMLSKFLGRQGFWGYFDFLWTIRQHHNL